MADRKILDNGMAVTLGLVGVVAAAGAVAKRGSAARRTRPRVYAIVNEWVEFRAPSGMKVAPAEEAKHRARHALAGKDKHWWEIMVGDPDLEMHSLSVSATNENTLTFATKKEAEAMADRIERGEVSVAGMETGAPWISGDSAKRGSAARTSHTASADFVERQLEKMDRLVEEITLNDAGDAVNDIERVMSAANFSGGFYDLPADLDDDAYALEQELEAARDEAQMLIDEEADEEAVLEKMENEVLPMIEKAIAQFRRAYAQEKRKTGFSTSAHRLVARRTGRSGWMVEDLAGGVWHPGEALQRRLAQSADPEAEVLKAARANRGGKWHS